MTSFVRRLLTAGATSAVVAMVAWGVAVSVDGWLHPQGVAAQIILPQPVAWTAIGASGTVDELSIPYFGFTGASALYKPTQSIAPLEFRYNVVNTHHVTGSAGGIPTIAMPGWTRLEFGAQAPATSTADAYLYRVNKCTGQQGLVCWVRHTNQPAPGVCRTCEFSSNTFDFSNYLYYVRVILDRNTVGEAPAAHTLRIY